MIRLKSAFYSIEHRTVIQETLDMTFRALDLSGRGNIDFRQFKYLITNVGKTIPSRHLCIVKLFNVVGDKLSDSEAEHLLSDVDINRDGVISYSEFVRMLSEEEEKEKDDKKTKGEEEEKFI